MTSSLVGSEMCIRDSNPPSAQLSGSFHPLTCPPTCPLVEARQYVTSLACLLYTSDAADDM
eukprot:4789148-Prorocentrum_lima.AAC.1